MNPSKFSVNRVVGIISTGDELVMPGSEIKEWQIYESNSFGIAALVEKMGGKPIRYDERLQTL